jgi:hypothetical protein
MYLCLCLCVHAYIRTCSYKHTCTHTHAHAHAHAHTHTHTITIHIYIHTPGDIAAVLSVGDSITAGFAMLDEPMEYRGYSYATGQHGERVCVCE